MNTSRSRLLQERAIKLSAELCWESKSKLNPFFFHETKKTRTYFTTAVERVSSVCKEHRQEKGDAIKKIKITNAPSALEASGFDPPPVSVMATVATKAGNVKKVKDAGG